MHILCLCTLGQTRSKRIANHLSGKGHETDFAGASVLAFNKVTQQRIDWADAVIAVTPIAQAALKKFDTTGKKVIMLDIKHGDEDVERKVDERMALWK